MENSHDGYVEEVYLGENISTDGYEVIIEHAEEFEDAEVVHRAPPSPPPRAPRSPPPPPPRDDGPPAWAASLIAMVEQVQDELATMKAAT